MTGGLLSFAGMRREQNAQAWLRANTDGMREDIDETLTVIGRLA